MDRGSSPAATTAQRGRGVAAPAVPRARDAAAASTTGPATEDPALASVVLCTRGRPQQLPACLRSLFRLDYPRFELVIVDNGTPQDGVAALVDAIAAEVTAAGGERAKPACVRVVPEPVPGLSRARNTGIAWARGALIAFTDDDAQVDPAWLTELERALSAVPGAGVATGRVVPAELDTQAARLFEEFGGHSKGRSEARQIIDPIDPRAQHPLYPLPAFGAGVNMAFRREVLEEIGGFDAALGAGSPAGGSEDTAAFSQALLRGFALVYTPTAVVSHHHRTDMDALQAQLAGYGRGLTAYYTKLVLDQPALLGQLIRLAPQALRDLRSRDSTRNAGLSANFPPELLRAELRGMVQGPAAYLRGRRRARAADRVDISCRRGDGATR